MYLHITNDVIHERDCTVGKIELNNIHAIRPWINADNYDLAQAIILAHTQYNVEILISSIMS